MTGLTSYSPPCRPMIPIDACEIFGRKEDIVGKTEIVAEPGIPQILITREFDATPEVLFRAYTDPELLVRWVGPRRLTMTVDRLENRDGGTWRFVHQDANKHEFGFHGVIHGTPSVNGIVRTFEFEGFPGHISLETLTFEGRGSKTVVRTNSVFQSVEDRDGTIESGMESGLNESMDRLEEVIADLSLVH